MTWEEIKNEVERNGITNNTKIGFLVIEDGDTGVSIDTDEDNNGTSNIIGFNHNSFSHKQGVHHA